jgi:hypothetical protein
MARGVFRPGPGTGAGAGQHAAQRTGGDSRRSSPGGDSEHRAPGWHTSACGSLRPGDGLVIKIWHANPFLRARGAVCVRRRGGSIHAVRSYRRDLRIGDWRD